MKKLFAFLAVFGMLMMGASVFAQEDPATDPVADDTSMVAQEEAAAPAEETAAVPEEEEKGGLSVLHTNLKTKFIARAVKGTDREGAALFHRLDAI